MSELKIGDKAPEFTLPSDGNREISLKDYQGQNVILYFYPKDDTSGCTKQAQGFSEFIEKFKEQNTVVIGVSKDSVASHDKFKAKYNLCFDLVSDEAVSLCQAYGVWKEKTMYGKKYMGVERTSFFIDETGTIQQIWPKVKIPGHVEAVLQAVTEYQTDKAV